MIKIEDIKIGSILQIRKVDLEDITSSVFIEIIDPNNIYMTHLPLKSLIWLMECV